jgi:predicted alpha/beta-hydrolase family hydrolase
MAEFLFNGLKTAAITLVLAHGAAGPMDSPFMETIAEGVARAGFRVDSSFCFKDPDGAILELISGM